MHEMSALSHIGRIAQLSVSPGGVPKRAVDVARVSAEGLEGDLHAYVHHGGPDRALCLFAIEQIRALVAEGHRLVPGSIGENVTLEGIDWSVVAPGTRWRLGERVVIEVTRYTTPCTKITACFTDGDFSRVSQKHHPGWSRVYARVLSEGVIRRDDPVMILAGGGTDALP
jgi:MOSC domain-containing protein YiiM